MTLDRRAAIAACKERKSVAGVFALRCAATGEVFVGASPNIDKAFNRLQFSLRTGAHPRPRLQAAWTAQGEAAFVFEALERLPEAPSPYLRDAALKERGAFWREKLAAAPA